MAYNNVDKRVVKFEFDNSQFDKKVKQSVKSINKLDESLQFKDVSKSLDKVKVKFSAFEVAAVSMIGNISNRIMNIGIRLVKSLSIDNITAGWDKFGKKTVSVGTLMAQTLKVAGKEITDYAEKIGIVNEQLDKLNWFTDETSYNFTDMVDNIGKFTAAGVDLDASVEAMMGIANWAALSGQNAATASRAMYQLAQSLGKGYVQLIDYKSIQNANMDTQEFRQTVLDTAVAMGELTKQGENYITKAGSKFTKNQFTEQLTAKWFTSGVLTKSLKKYSAAVEDLYEITEREGITASEAIEKYGDAFDDFAIKAFKAAQEARTFSDAINSVKDAVSTGWMTTAENIFGDYDTAKVFWTDIANELYDVFAASAAYRNQMLKLWADMEGRADLFAHTGEDDQGAFWNIYDAIIAIKNTFASAWDAVFPKSTFEDAEEQALDLGNRLKQLTSNWQKLTLQLKKNVIENQNVKNILIGVYSTLKIIIGGIQSVKYAIDPVIYSLKQIVNNILDFAGYLGKTISESTEFASVMFGVAEKINSLLSNVFEILNPSGILKTLFNFVKQIISSITQIGEGIKEGLKISLGFVPEVKDLGSTIADVTANISKNISKLLSFLMSKVVPIVSEVFNAVGKVIGVIAGTVKNLIKILINASSKIVDFFKENEIVAKIINGISNAIGWLAEKIKGLVTQIRELANSKKSGSLADLLPFSKEGEGEKQKKTLKEFWNDAVESSSILQTIVEVLTSLYNIIIAAGKLFKAVIDVAVAVLKDLTKYINMITDFLNSLLQGEKDTKEKLKKILIVSASLLMIFELVKIFINLKWMIEFAKANIMGVLDDFADAAIKNSWANIIKSIGSVITNIGIALALVAVSMSIFDTIDEKGFKRGLMVMSIMSGLMILLTVLSKRLTRGINGAIPGFKKLSDSTTRLGATVQRSSISELSWLLVAFSVSMLSIAKAFTSFDSLSASTWEKSEKILAIMAGTMLAMVVVCRLISSKGTEVKSAYPGIMSFIGISIAIKAMSNALYKLFTLDIIKTGELSKAAKQMLWIFAGVAGALTIISGIIKIIITRMRLAAAKISKEGKSISILGNVRTSPLAQIFLSLAVFMLSFVGALKILEKVVWISEPMQKILKQAMIFVITLTGIMAILEVVLKSLDLASKRLDKKYGGESANSKKKNNSPIAGVISSLAAMLLSFSGAMWILGKIDFSDTEKWQKIITKLSIFMGVMFALVIALSAILKDSAYEKIVTGKGKEMAKEGTKISSAKSGITGILLAMTALIMSIAAAMAILSVIPITDDRFDKLTNLLIGIITIIGVMVVLAALLNSKTSKTNTSGFAGAIKLALAIALLSGALVAVVASMTYALEGVETMNPDSIKKLGLMLLAIVGLGAIIGVIPVISAGLLAFSASILLFGAGLWVLGWGLEKFMPQMELIGKLDKTSMVNLLELMAILSGASILSGPGMILLGVGLIALAYGMEILLDNADNLAKFKVGTFSAILAILTAFGNIGALAGPSIAALGAGIAIMGAGLLPFAEAISKLPADLNFKTFNGLMGRLVAWGTLGALSGPGLLSLGISMGLFAAHLEPFGKAIETLPSDDKYKMFNKLMGRLVAWGTLGMFAGPGLLSLGLSIGLFAAFLTPFSEAIETLPSDDKYKMFNKLMGRLVAWGTLGMASSIGLASLVGSVWLFSNTLEPFGTAIRSLDGINFKTFNGLMGRLVAWGTLGMASSIGLASLALAVYVFGEYLGKFAENIYKLPTNFNFKTFNGLMGRLVWWGTVGIASGKGLSALSEAIRVLSSSLSGFADGLTKVNNEKLSEFLQAINENAVKKSNAKGIQKLGNAIKSLTDPISDLSVSIIKWGTANGNWILYELLHNLGMITKSDGKNIKSALQNISYGIYTLSEAIDGLSLEKLNLLKYLSDIVQFGLSNDDDIVIRPILDLTNVEQGIENLKDMLNNINSPILTIGNVNKAVAKNESLKEQAPSSTENNTTNINNTFNITSNDPDAVAKAVSNRIDRQFQQNRKDIKLVYGGG